MNKCEKCIWADRRSGNKIICPFLSCVVDKKVLGGGDGCKDGMGANSKRIRKQ